MINLYSKNIIAIQQKESTFVSAELTDETESILIHISGEYQTKQYYAVHYLLNEHKEGILTEEDVGEFSSFLYCNYKLLYGYDDLEKFMEE